ncbi:hypothetical protein AERO9AM_20256 [Aeromicrobium sp. 9AM]|nr:hypothetical protein AERO9AM_20256 [Aeromicrobium sp. 9AM]
MLGQVVDEESRNRHLPSLVRLGGAPHHAESLHRGDRFGDDGPPFLEVDASHAQCRHLPEPHARVGQEQDDEAIHLIGALVMSSMLADLGWVAAGLGQGIDLRMGQVTPLVLDRSREVDLGGDVPNEPPVPDGHVEHERKHAVDFANRRRRLGPRQLGDPYLDLGVRHSGELDVAPRRIDVLAHDTLIPLLGRRLELGLAREPELCPLPHGHSRERRVDVRTGVLRAFDTGQEPFGIDLAVEGLVALLPGGCSVVRTPDALAVRCALLNAGHDRLLVPVSMGRRGSSRTTDAAVDRLLVQPRDHIGPPVANGTADAEAARSGSHVAPVPQSGNWGAYQSCSLAERQDNVFGVIGSIEAFGHRGLLEVVVCFPKAIDTPARGQICWSRSQHF